MLGLIPSDAVMPFEGLWGKGLDEKYILLVVIREENAA